VVRGATVAMQRRGNYTSTTIEVLCFLHGPFRGVSLVTIGATFRLITAESRDIRRIVKTWAREPEGSPVLEAVVRERLLKTQQSVKRLSGCCDELWIVEISSSVVITCSSEWCIQVFNKPIHQSIPRLLSPPLNTWQYVDSSILTVGALCFIVLPGCLLKFSALD
jgi:hypothetical protein